MSDITTAFWGMTINNYDETDLALVQQGYPDHIRQIVYTLERGVEGTPHIQAFIKLFRQQRLSYVKKLFPRGSFKALTVDVYKLNAQRYAQKLDSTAESGAVISNNPFPDPVVELTSVVEAAFENFGDGSPYYLVKDREFNLMAILEERARVAEKPALAKFYVSSTYKNVKKEFWRSIAEHIDRAKKSSGNIGHTHTHTHSDEKFSVAEGINNEDGEDDEEREDGSGSSEGEDDEEDCEDNEEGEGSDVEGWDEGGDDESC